MEQNDWEALVRQIRKGTCTPFLGAGVNEPFLPLGRELAETLADKYNYPFGDTGDLIRVSQYIATTTKNPQRPKEEVLELLDKQLLKIGAEKVCLETEVYSKDGPIGMLSELPFSVYITTNYDPLVCNALKSRKRDCQREFCRWNNALKDPKRTFPAPSREAPVVFHLHGADQQQDSLVLTEDDYVAFLVNLRQDIIPPRINESLVNSMLFIGYSLQDWNFRVLHQALLSARDVVALNGSLSVQMPWEKDPDKQRLAEAFLNQYFGDRKISVYWGTAKAFLAELMRHWNNQ